jgi:hypothetical protein
MPLLVLTSDVHATCLFDVRRAMYKSLASDQRTCHLSYCVLCSVLFMLVATLRHMRTLIE